MKQKGFTLIEILVTVALIAVFAAVLSPVLSRVREKGRQTSCTSNLKQLGMAFTQYAQDYNDHFPNVLWQSGGVNREGGWVFYSAYDPNGFNSSFDVTRGSLFPYTKNAQIYICPSDPVGRKTGNSYTLNYGMWRDIQLPYCFGRELPDIQYPSLFIMAVAGQETLGASTDDGAGFVCVPSDGTCTTATWHSGGENVLHVDGHVKVFTLQQLSSG